MSRNGKTIALWLVLVALFVAFYQLFSTEPAQGQPSSGTSPASWWWVFAVVLAGAIIYGRFQANRPWRKQYDAGLQAFAKGHFALALDLWTQCYEKSSWKPTVRFNIASARLNLWQLKRAREDLLESLALAAKGKQAQLPPLAWVQVAFIDALEGKLASSREATVKAGASKDIAVNLPSLTQAVLDLREGRVEQAHRALRSSEMRQITGTLGELVRALDAYCVFLGSGEVRHVDKVALFQEAAGDELLAAWPEFSAFLAKAPQS